jgi:three-Cys-motif partner protein
VSEAELTPTDARLSSLDNQAFWARRKAAAILKHAILRGYVVPFASKTGSSSQGKRVVAIDGYAGAGSYDDGSPGSPVLLAEAAKLPILNARTVECYFVEQDRETFEKLKLVLATAAADLRFEARHGSIEDYLDELLTRADGSTTACVS